ncbi:MAG: alpha-glucosidase C-terminal domain-containing protein [Cytophagales bacterium]
MTNIRFTSIDQYRDIETLGKYQKVKNDGGDIAAFIEAQKRVARDNGRTPFQWDTTGSAGFTTGNPWLPVNQNHKQVNRLQQEQDSASVLSYFRKVVKLHKQNSALLYGSYHLLDESNPSLYCYTRESGNEKLLVVLNFTANTAQLNTDIKPEELTPLLHNYSTPPELKKIRPYEAVVYRVGN